jgi:beta-lactamase regulating signal transducer with metallopeptidase domain
MIALLVWLLDTTVKGSLLILVVAALHRAIGARVDARWRHALWAIVLVRLLLPDAPSSSFSVFNLLPGASPLTMSTTYVVDVPVARIAGEPRALREALAPATPRALAIARWLAAIWLAGVAFFIIRALVATVRMRSAIRRETDSSAPIATAPMRIVECDAVRTPALHGLLRPVLLLPRGFTASFTEEELRHVVMHELWHVRRLDVAMSWLLAAAQAIHWFNPLVWFAASRIREERELSCDELALSLLEEDERPGYGRTILKLLESCRAAAPVPALVGIVNGKEKMKRRILMIASFRNRTRFTFLFLTIVAAVAAFGLTDGEERRRMKFTRVLDPAAIATVEKLQAPVTLELTGASLSELITAVSNKSGVVITQSPEAATSPIQSARFTIKAENVAAHMVLMESLIPFELDAVPGADGVSIAKGDGHEKGPRKFRVMKVEDGEHAPGEIREEVFVRKIEKAEAGQSADGKIRRELTLKTDRNGEKAEGRLSIEITK